MDWLTALAEGLMPLKGHVLLGLSGGADSVALLRTLLILRTRGGVTLSAVHVEHGLRGAASQADADFVAALCERWDVPLTTCHLTPPEHAGETWAREARWQCFRQAMTATGADMLALAQHRGDQAETLLLHLLRGSGLDGLCAMARDSRDAGFQVVRPLLNVDPRALRGALTEAGQPWREDATNADDTILRNALRHEVMPLLERLSPGAETRLAETAGLLRLDAEVIRTKAKQVLDLLCGRDWLPLDTLQNQQEGIRRQMLRMWWQRWDGQTRDQRGLDRAQTEALLALADAKAGARCNLPGGAHGQRGWQCLHLVGEQRRIDTEIPLSPVMTGASLGDTQLTVLPSQGNAGDGTRVQEVPRAWLAGCVLRTRRDGDRIRPYGMAGSRKLQDYLTDRRVDAPFRDRVPLILRDGEVLLVGGVGAGQVPPWNPEADNVRLMWSGDMPWMRK